MFCTLTAWLCASAVAVLAPIPAANGTATAQDPRPASSSSTPASAASAEPIRVMLRARNGGADRLTSLRYIGGFETKSLLYETLVKRAPDGRLIGGLASKFWFEDGGRTCWLQIRDGATFHDGRPVTAETVRLHFERWIGLPEHDWLACNRRIAGVEAVDERVVKVQLTEPYTLLDDLCAINPCAVVGPGSRDWEGEFQRPVGTGPFRFVAAVDGGNKWRLQQRDADGALLEVGFLPRGRDRTPVDLLKAGTIDAFVGGWDEDLPADALAELTSDARFAVQEAPGSSVAYISFRLTDGPTADVAVRRRIQAIIDRPALIAAVEAGRAAPCTTWAAPTVRFWPRSKPVAPPEAPEGPLPTLKIAVRNGEDRASRIAVALAAQLRAAGFNVDLLRPPAATAEAASERSERSERTDRVGTVRPLDSEAGEVRQTRNRAWRELASSADLRIEITHGMPYDPHQSLVARFGPTPPKNADQPRPRGGVDLRLQQLVGTAMATVDEAARAPVYAEIQALIDRDALIVPLYSPHRVALRRTDIEGIGLSPDCYAVDLSRLQRVAR